MEGTATESIGYPTHQLVQLRKKRLKLHLGFKLMGIIYDSSILAARCVLLRNKQPSSRKKNSSSSKIIEEEEYQSQEVVIKKRHSSTQEI